MATKAAAKRKDVIPVQPAQVYTRINSLLYTLRSIAQCEDQLCTLMHHLRTSGKLNASLASELHGILDEIPSQEYLHDLEKLRSSLAGTEDKGGTPAKTPRSRAAAKRKAA